MCFKINFHKYIEHVSHIYADCYIKVIEIYPRSNHRIVKSERKLCICCLQKNFCDLQNKTFLIKSFTISIKYFLFLYKVKLLATRCAIAICTSAQCNVTKRETLFKVPSQKVTFEYHRNPKIISTTKGHH